MFIIEDALEDFFSNSSFHGLRFIAKRTGNHWTERLFWAVCCTLSCYGSILLILSAHDTFQNNRLSFVVSTTYLDWSTSFPSVSVCETENNNKSKLQAIEYFKENYDANKMAVMHDIAFFQDTTPYLIKTCQQNSRKKVFNCSGIDIVSLARTIRSSCEETFDRCLWNGEDFDCCSHFLQLETELGICYSINNVQTINSSQPGKTMNFKSDRNTGPGSLLLHFRTTTNVFMHSRSDVPNLNAKETDVVVVQSRPRSQHEVYLSVHETENVDGVGGMEAKKRKCLFPWEGYPGYYSHYSYSACIVECRRRAEMDLCNCTRHLLPYTGETGKICDINNIFCIKRNEYFLLSLKAHWVTKKDALNCPCLSGCEDIQIDTILRRDQEIVNGENAAESSVELKLLYLPSEKYKRSVVRNKLDLVVSMGSAVALFFGASLLSFVEIIYYFSLRLCRPQRVQEASCATAVRTHRRIRAPMILRHTHLAHDPGQKRFRTFM
ncbi:sodium channel protein Nach [Cryptotermes secundus]|uniref:sodium channel protein Nach n=1 Tax=Cryptotermes secundus TaxID=105785 RepID=UPI000CD7B4A9|nr:sodium channel protein Nach [Cryptotermes secundus]